MKEEVERREQIVQETEGPGFVVDKGVEGREQIVQETKNTGVVDEDDCVC